MAGAEPEAAVEGPSGAAAPPPVAPPPVAPLPAGVKARVVTRAVQALFGLSALVAPAVVLLALSARGDLALGLALGHGAAQAVSLTWLVAAARRFDDAAPALLRATLGLAPVRVVLLIGAMLVGPRLGGDAAAIFGGFLATLVVGHLVEAWALGALADAARAARRAARPGG